MARPDGFFRKPRIERVLLARCADFSSINEGKEDAMFKKIVTGFLCALLALSFGVGDSRADDKNLIIATATTGGTYYPVGVAIGTLISVKLAKKHKITATAINSAGSGENVQMLKNKETDMAILQALFGQNAYNGLGPYKGKPMRILRTWARSSPSASGGAVPKGRAVPSWRRWASTRRRR
jgi:TRAP transporter TAXI family solute receptor